MNTEVKVDHFANVIRDGKAKKLSPKTENHVFYEIAIHDEENQLCIRLKGNEGGGLHSKEWIPLEDIIAVLTVQKDKPFKSTVLKCVFKGGMVVPTIRAFWRLHCVGYYLSFRRRNRCFFTFWHQTTSNVVMNYARYW